jgi:hypothetical protein
LIDRAAMILGDAARALVNDLVCSLVVHPASLPPSFRLSNPMIEKLMDYTEQRASRSVSKKRTWVADDGAVSPP